jgi:tetratricopeptide (TPR) repeat protein
LAAKLATATSLPFGLISRRITLVAIAAALGLTGCSRYVSRHLAEADAHFQKREYGEAASEYITALRFDSDNLHGLQQLGLTYYNLGELREAFVYLSRAKALDSNSVAVRLKLGNIYLIDGRPDQAQEEASAALAIDPNNREALKLEGSANIRKREPGKAVAVFERMVAADSADADGHYLLGIALLSTGNRAAATRELQRSLALSPKQVDAAMQLVQLYIASNRADSALALTNRTIAVASNSARLQNLLGAVHAVRNETAAAEQAFVAAIALDSSQVDARVALADLLGRSKRKDAALATLDTALRINPKNVPALLVRGEVYERAAEMENALESYELAAALAPTDRSVLDRRDRARKALKAAR